MRPPQDTPSPRTCGHPTRDGSPCRRPPLAGGGERCSRHAGLPTTRKERDAAKRAAVKHGYYVSGFLDETERDMFRRIAEGHVDPGEIVRQSVAALYVRAMRMAFWEGEDGEASPLTTAAFAELRQHLADRGYYEVNVAHHEHLKVERSREEARRQLGPEGLAQLREQYSAELESPGPGKVLSVAEKDELRALLGFNEQGATA